MQTLETAAAYEQLSSGSGGALLVLHFAAGWAPQCAQMRDVLRQLAADHPAVVFAEVGGRGREGEGAVLGCHAVCETRA